MSNPGSIPSTRPTLPTIPAEARAATTPTPPAAPALDTASPEAKNPMRGELSALRAETKAAAAEARDLGLISEGQFARMTDGTVSNKDLKELRERLLDAASDGSDGTGSNAAIGRLYDSVASQYAAQGSLRTILEGLKDFRGQ